MNYIEVKQIFRIKDENYGNSNSDLIKKESELGLSLPNDLKLYYQNFGKFKKLNDAINDFTALEDLEISSNREVIIYYDKQTTLNCYFNVEELNKGDIRLHWRTLMERDWHCVTDDLYLSIKMICLHSAMHCMPNRAIQFGSNQLKIDLINSTFKKLDQYFKPFNTTFYQNNPNHILGTNISGDSILISIAANNEDDFNDLIEILKIDWRFVMRDNEVVVQRFGGIG